MKDRSFEKGGMTPKEKVTVELLEDIHLELVEMNKFLRKLVGTQPSPS